MRVEDVVVGQIVVHDSAYNEGENDFYEISEIDGDYVELALLAVDPEARRIPGTKQWKIKYVHVREKWIDFMNVSMYKLLGEYDVYDVSKTYSVVLNNNPGYSYLEYDSDTDSKPNEGVEKSEEPTFRKIGKTYLHKGDIYMQTINHYCGFWLIKTLTTESSGKLEVDKLEANYTMRRLFHPRYNTKKEMHTVFCRPYAVIDSQEFTLNYLDHCISSGEWVEYEPKAWYLDPKFNDDRDAWYLDPKLR